MDEILNLGIKPFAYGSPEYQALVAEAQMFEKALTVGNDIVLPGATGGDALRPQFLVDGLHEVLFDEDTAARSLRLIGTQDVSSTAIEFDRFDDYGLAGDGFTAELGDDGQGNVLTAEDRFMRMVSRVKYLATQRERSRVSSHVKTVAPVEMTQEKAGTRALLAAANHHLWKGHSDWHDRQFDGFEKQMLDYVAENSGYQDVLFDAGGQTIDSYLLNAVAALSANRYSSGNLTLIQSVIGRSNTAAKLFPQLRGGFGDKGGFGLDVGPFVSHVGPIPLEWDPHIRANSPLLPWGRGANGKPRDATTADPNALAFSTNPITSAATAVTAVAPGLGPWFITGNRNTDAAAMGVTPSLPSGAGNQANRLAQGTHYYAVAPVWRGREGIPWVYGAAAAGTHTGATGVVVTAGLPVVKIVIDPASIPGLGTTYARKDVMFRVYRASAAPGGLSSFDYLYSVGCPQNGSPTFFDNGMFIAGADNAYLINKRVLKFMQLLPLQKIPLPHRAMLELFALLLWGTLVVFLPSKNIWIRNVKPTSEVAPP